jgi:hypothetical protein
MRLSSFIIVLTLSGAGAKAQYDPSETSTAVLIEKLQENPATFGGYGELQKRKPPARSSQHFAPSLPMPGLAV